MIESQFCLKCLKIIEVIHLLLISLVQIENFHNSDPLMLKRETQQALSEILDILNGIQQF
jgi:uncharacterized membrane protein